MKRPPTLRVRDWESRFEKNRTKELVTMAWRPEPTDLNDDVYTTIVDHPEGAAHYGVLTALRNVAAKGKPRGTLLMENGQPHTAETLSRKTRLPQELIQTVIDRCLALGELENVTQKSRIKNRLPPQEGAGKPHPEEKRLDQKTSSSDKKRLEGKDQITADENRGASRPVQAESPHSEQNQIPINLVDDDDSESYATPVDELKALYQKRTGERIALKLLDDVRGNLGGEVSQTFIDELKAHNGKFTNFAGFLRKLSKERNRPASAPMTKAEAALRNYKCQACGSTNPGRGLRLVNGTYAACECASAEYIQAMKANGTLPPDDMSDGTDTCRHGKEDGTCSQCLPRKDFNAMTEVLE